MDALGGFSTWTLLLVVLWTLPWKGVALWRAARGNHKGWFVALLVFQTLAILEILYIFVFAKRAERSRNLEAGI